MRRVFLIALFVGAFVIFTLSATPLAAVLDIANVSARGISYDRADGTIWRGVVRGLRAPGQDLGDVALRAPALSLLLASPRVELTIQGPAVTGSGSIRAGLTGVVTVRDLSLNASIAELTRLEQRIRIRGGTAEVNLSELRLNRNGCISAAGAVRSDVLTRPDERSDWTGPELSGEVSCEDGRLVLNLDGADDGARINAYASVDVHGGAQVRVRVDTADPQLRSLLPLLGFDYEDEGFTYVRNDGPTAPPSS